MKSKKSIVFISNSLFLEQNEEDLINKCAENEILILSYSRAESKKGTIENLRKSTGKDTEFREIKRTTELNETLLALNKDYDLHIDVTYAAPYHMMELIPYGYLAKNNITTFENGQFMSSNRRFRNYGVVNDTAKDILRLLRTGEKTEKDIVTFLEAEARDKEGPEYRTRSKKPTVNRVINNLYDNGYVCKKEPEHRGISAVYYLDDNQMFMYDLTVNELLH